MALLDPALLGRLEKLRLAARKSFAGSSPGEHRSSSKGSSAEFADHRDYCLGDDPRALDWNAYARLDKLFVKLFRLEAEVPLHLVVDASASMGFGEPEKLRLAKQVAAGLAYVALANLDRAGLLTLGGEGKALPPGRGHAWLLRLWRRLEDLQAEGRPDPAAAARRYCSLQRRPGLVVLISDFLDPAFQEAIKALLYHRHEVWCVQVLSAEDRGEGLSGDLRLIDSETGEPQEVTVSRDVLVRYRAELEDFQASLRRFCAERGVSFLSAGAQDDFWGIVLNLARRARPGA